MITINFASFLRVIVAPAGPSALWELWRVRWRKKLASLFPSARKTWWTAAPVMVTWAAGEGTSPNPSATSSATEAWTRRAFILTNTRSSSHSNDAHAWPHLHQLQKNFPVLQKGECRYSVQGKAGSCSSFHILPQGDEETLKAVVARVGPVAVAVNAMLPSFHLYRRGEVPERRLVRRVDRRESINSLFIQIQQNLFFFSNQLFYVYTRFRNVLETV